LKYSTVQDFANGGVVRRQVGAYSPERRPWGRINSTLCNHLTTCFKSNIYTKIC